MKPKWYDNKWFIVTGGTSGIGLEITKKLLANNANVLAITNSKEQINNASNLLKPEYGEKINFLLADVTDKQDREKIVDTAAEKENLAGIIQSVGITSFGEFLNTPEDYLVKQIRTNFEATVIMTRKILPLLIRQTHKGPKYLAYISSTTAVTGVPFFGAYSATKAGSDMFFRMLKYELPENIRILIIRPGAVKTPFYTNAKEYGNASIQGLIQDTASSFTTPEKVANALIKAINKKKTGVIYPDLQTKLQVKLVNNKFIGNKLMKYYANIIKKHV